MIKATALRASKVLFFNAKLTFFLRLYGTSLSPESTKELTFCKFASGWRVLEGGAPTGLTVFSDQGGQTTVSVFTIAAVALVCNYSSRALFLVSDFTIVPQTCKKWKMFCEQHFSCSTFPHKGEKITTTTNCNKLYFSCISGYIHFK